MRVLRLSPARVPAGATDWMIANARLFAPVTKFVMRLSDHSRLRHFVMSGLSRNIQVMWSRRDFDRCLPAFAPDATFEFVSHFMDLPPVNRGHREIGAMFEQWHSAWASTRLEPVAMAHRGRRVCVLSHMTGQGSGSGVEMREQTAYVIELRDGLIARQVAYRRWDEALQALHDDEIVPPAERIESARA